MNSKQMLARYAQGGMVDEVGQLRAAMGGEVSDARRMLQNLQAMQRPPVYMAAGGWTTDLVGRDYFNAHEATNPPAYPPEPGFPRCAA